MKERLEWRERPKQSIPISRGRIIAILSPFFLLVLLTIIRLTEVQLVRHKEFTELAEIQQLCKREIEPSRGHILDRVGSELAVNLLDFTAIGINPSEIKNRNIVVTELSGILQIDATSIRKKLKEHTSFFWAARKVDPAVAEQVRSLGLSGVIVQKDTKRDYPYLKVGGQVVGYVNVDNEGLGGIELKFDHILSGTPGWEVLQRYGRKSRIKDNSLPRRHAVNGGTIILSIDINAQAIAEEELEKAVKAHDATGGMIVITKPATGEIIAIASSPRFDPNNFMDFSYIARQNRSVTVAFEPGSTFKVVPFAGLIDQKLIRIDEEVYCENGEYQIWDRMIRDTHLYQILKANEVLAKSSNIGTIKLAKRLDDDDFYTLIRDFGFGATTGIGLNGETRGLLRKPNKWSGVSHSNLSIGQGIGVTAVQLAIAYGAIANNGLLMRPLLVLSVSQSDGKTELFESEVVRRVLRPSTARAMRLLLAEAVEQGTGGNAIIEGIRVAGKTGTAQKVNHEKNEYYQDRFVSSFAGFLPVEQPELLAVIVIDDPQEQYFGGTVAAPVFKKVMERLMVILPCRQPYLTDDSENEEEFIEARVAPKLVGLTREEAEKILERKNITPVWIEEGEIVIVQGTPPGTPVRADGSIQLVLDPGIGKTEEIKVPDLKGMNLRQAMSTLTRIGLFPHVEGYGLVSDQIPAPGANLMVGDSCRIFAGKRAEMQLLEEGES
ncbi:MAG: penicillin-binding transpeptidase domain-containing protein [Candidatus Electryonea clarkiae]|nr:penicillin-binding transpeptidase domain-containing protein [Candidatus Electryonea clarkiae]